MTMIYLICSVLFLQNLPSDAHVIAVDLPGHGDSDTPTDDYDISHMFCSVLFFQNLPSDAHVIAVDLPGHGDSDTPTDDYDISHMFCSVLSESAQ